MDNTIQNMDFTEREVLKNICAEYASVREELEKAKAENIQWQLARDEERKENLEKLDELKKQAQELTALREENRELILQLDNARKFVIEASTNITSLRESVRVLMDDLECYCLNPEENMGRNPCGYCRVKALTVQGRGNRPPLQPSGEPEKEKL